MYRILILLGVVLIAAVETVAQTTNQDSLFWVVETNIHNPSYTIVKFYNRRDEMVHEVRLQGVRIDICNPRHRKKLDEIMAEYYERVVALPERVGSKYTLQLSKQVKSRRSQF